MDLYVFDPILNINILNPQIVFILFIVWLFAGLMKSIDCHLNAIRKLCYYYEIEKEFNRSKVNIFDHRLADIDK